MQNALYIEISTIGICLLLVILFNQRQNIGSSTVQRQFNILIYATIAALIIDTATWLLDGATFPLARPINIAVETLYFFFNFLVPYLWVAYIELTLSKEQIATFIRLRLLAIPMFVMAVVLLINLRTGIIFRVDENNIYYRGPGIIIVVAVVYAYLGYATIRALGAARRASWTADKKRYYPMAFFMVLPAAGGIIQTFVYGVTLIWVFIAVSIMLLYIDSLNRQISADPLTGINNRRELDKYVFNQMKDSVSGGVLALIMMDVDGFKQVNDTHGHFYGDRVLVTVADILKESCKKTTAFLARYGGDEFCIVYRARDTETVETLIADIQNSIARWNEVNQAPVTLGLSIGYSVWQSETEETADALYKNADREMYRIKDRKKAIAS